ncbi:MAG: adenylyl-sulfate kinase [Firmicutes bacterium]|nr:adenylyl-sulfate kinase [Bacillota bacterium]
MNGLLKFITCGSVDDGKSTLIGHMLYDAKLIFADQEKALVLDSKIGSREGEIDYSLLLDGLMAEREQGITIDVAYRYFTTEKRSFIVADTPGHEEYTRNMAVGASFADLAVILIDASQGVLVQTRRHARICSLMGIKHFVFAVNKMDLIAFDEERFNDILAEIKVLMSEFEYDSLAVIPVSATDGDNVTERSERTLWYDGKSLLEYLEDIDVSSDDAEAGFTMPIQRVCRPNSSFRGFQGQIETGTIAVGDEIRILPSSEKACVKEIITGFDNVQKAVKGQAVNICLDREIDASRGCVIVKDAAAQTGNMFTVKLLWMDDARLVAGKNYMLKIGTKRIPAVVMDIKYKIDVNTRNRIDTDTIYKNEIAVCDISTSEKIVLDEFRNNPALGSFILIDRVSHMTSACGVVTKMVSRADNLTWHDMTITREQRALQKGQRPKTIWLTGLSGSGKSTIANEIEKRLFLMGRHTMSLDGDNVRLGLNKNLGFAEGDRIENIRRVAEVAKLMNDAGVIVITSFISPYERDRLMARDIVGSDDFIEIYVSTPIEECEKRDVKGLYKKAREGKISSFTGVSSPYEVPTTHQIEIDTSDITIEEAADIVMKQLEKLL